MKTQLRTVYFQKRASSISSSGIMSTKWQDHITSMPGILQGKPDIQGTRIPVGLVLEYLADGYSVANILAEFPDLTEETIAACLDYARELSSFEVAA